MNEITETASHTSFSTVQPTTSFAEIGDGRELAVDGACCVPARVQRIAGLLRRVFVFEACVDVADEICTSHHCQLIFLKRHEREKEGVEGREPTVIVIIADNHLLNLAKLAHLAPEVLIEGIKVVLQLARIHLVLRVVGWVLVQVWEEDGLAVGGLDVFARAAVPVSAGADLVVE